MMTTSEKSKSLNNCLTLSDISWEKFEQIEAIFTEVEGVRFVYFDHVLEIMILGTEHEYDKRTISLLLDAYLRTRNIRFYSTESVTLGSKSITGRKEPDESYSFYSQKDIPDLVIEVIITSGNIDVLQIYRRIGIREVWLYQDDLLSIYALNDEQYLKIDRSQLLPELNVSTLTKYITHPDQYDAVSEFLQELECC